MDRKMLMDESKVFDACALVEEIVKQLTTTSCPVDTVIPFVTEKASKASPVSYTHLTLPTIA